MSFRKDYVALPITVSAVGRESICAFILALAMRAEMFDSIVNHIPYLLRRDDGSWTWLASL